jgi:non-canonical poly(A) RNA polymerase PAPD5/7
MLLPKTWVTGKDFILVLLGSPADSHRLHKEIMDFYHHVKPRDFEEYVRSDLVDRLRNSVRLKWRDADIHAFGSFVAGLYLPTADMDLVFVSDEYMAGRRPIYNTKKFLWKFQSHLISEGLAAEGSIEVIANARVPLVKYVDYKTGLRVDVSFENYTGINANKTFQDWKAKYPAMPILVTLIKQFLTMRGLNEPVNGGIGGFTVTCLVTSLLQLLPQVQSGNMIPEHHLGEVLMEFFDLYGNEFNAVTTAIQLHPPGYVSKVGLSILSLVSDN